MSHMNDTETARVSMRLQRVLGRPTHSLVRKKMGEPESEPHVMNMLICCAAMDNVSLVASSIITLQGVTVKSIFRVQR